MRGFIVREKRRVSLNPNDLGLAVDSWRNGQLDAIMKSVLSPKRFVGQCMPTGWGKSICLVGQALASGKRTLILTGSRELQDQYAREFRSLNILDIKGKSNYTCRAMEVGGEFYDGSPARMVDQGPCQFGEECGLRMSGCTYYDKIPAARYRRLVSSNYAAYISANLYTEGWGQFDFIACDEAHEAEDWMARMLSVRLPRCYAKLTGTKLPTTTDVKFWAQWADRELPMVKAAIRIEKRNQAKASKKRVMKLRTLQSLESSLNRMRMMTSEWRVFPEATHILFQPIWVHEYAESLLFTGASKVVFASSTMVPNTINLLGIPDRDMEFWSYPSTFPVARRPIYYQPVVRMRYGMPEEEERLWVDAVDNFISTRLDRKGIIHTVSYARQNLLLKYSKFANLMVASSPSSAQGTTGTSLAKSTLQKFRASNQPSVLIGPSWSTGIDLKYKQCEYTIIPKVPFPDITDPLHMARSEDNPDYSWYHAGIKLTQSIGRAMRAEDDQNETLITDMAFGTFMSRHRQMIPGWIWDAVQVGTPPSPLEAL
jgi:Rad3-related DNA helicase